MKIPNQSAIPFQSRIFESDIDILQAAVGGRNGVISPTCEVSEHGTPAMSVDVASGSVVSEHTLVVVTGATVLIGDSDPTDPRFDLIVANDDGTVDVVAGIPDPAPYCPSPGAGQVGLAQVWIPAGDTAVTDNQIVDKRVYVDPPNTANAGWTTIQATDQTTGGTRSNTAALANDSQLTFTMASNTKYRVRGRVLLSTIGTSGGKWTLHGPTGASYIYGSSVQLTETASSMSPIMWTAYDAVRSLLATGVHQYEITFELTVHNGSTAGAFAFQWAQATAVAENTVRRDQSYIEYA